MKPIPRNYMPVCTVNGITQGIDGTTNISGYRNTVAVGTIDKIPGVFTVMHTLYSYIYQFQFV